MSTGLIVLISVSAVLLIAIVVLFILGRRAQKKQEEQQVEIEAHKQTISMLIIDKKKLKMKDSGLPQYVIDQSPKLMRNTKLPIIKAKVGPQIMSLICDEKIFDSVPIRKEVKAQVSGIYIVGVKGLHGTIKTTQKKKSRWKKTIEKLQEKAGAKPL
jgi:uncharacterized membrane protein YdfJ with MMPL/SSD domain